MDLCLKHHFRTLKNFAAKLLSLFGSTYICEQAFSWLKINKLENRSMLTDCNLNAVMRITTSKLVPHFKTLSKSVNSYIHLIEFNCTLIVCKFSCQTQWLLSLYISYIVNCTLFQEADKMYMRCPDSPKIFNVALRGVARNLFWGV